MKVGIMKLDYNNLYYFRYKAIGEKTGISVYDKTPLVFPLSFRDNAMIGLNIHWIPKKERAVLFNELVEIIKKTYTTSRGKERTRLTYELLKRKGFKTAIQYGIRMYYISGISQLKNIKETQWNIIVSEYGTLRQNRMRKVYKKNDYED
jgi:hypothetical protein